MSRKFVHDFNQAIKATAPGSTGLAILNVLTAVGCVIAVPFTLGALSNFVYSKKMSCTRSARKVVGEEFL